MPDINEAALTAVFDQLEAAGANGFWGVLRHDGKDLKIRMKGLMPSVPKQLYARELCDKLNRELHHDGRWCVGWTDWSLEQWCDYTRLVMIFMDKDGDTQFVVDNDEAWSIQCLATADFIEQCSQAIAAWKEHHKLVGKPREDQIIRAALGQESKDPYTLGPLPTNLD